MKNLDIAFSPCPNDTFIFHAMLHGLVDTKDLNFIPFLDDVETLNQKAFSGRFPVTKLSFYAYLKLLDQYELLDAGSALGYGCGPLLVARTKQLDLFKSKIAMPGNYTTANLLFNLWRPGIENIEFTHFDNILEGVESGEYDAGVIIHEGRFVYKDYNLMQIIDLGEWWEKETGLPIPLGCIAVKKESEIYSLKGEIENIIRASLNYAFQNRMVSREYIKGLSQELDDNVIDSHIDLYVNEFTVSLGDKGREAINALVKMAKSRGLI
jgi:1,4-dihydroxy-6-naphthoate synthase